MPTIRRCCIIGCLSNSRQNPHLQFFQFPRPENPFHKLWKEACHASLRRILPFKKPVVCALHFDPSCLGGRRLTSNAVPTQRLEVPSNLEAVEQQAMIEEIERSRKCAYINAVVYEWLVRANMNAQLRGSITHGMIKEKAENARQLIGSNSFIADNRWLNRFRETHLTGFAQKLATNQLKPMGSSLWIPDIVQDLQHLFPPASAERVAKLEEMPEQYMNYMQQYGEYEEEDDDSKDQSYMDQSHYQLQQQQQAAVVAAHHMQSTHPPPPHAYAHHPGYDPYAAAHHPGYNSFGDFYYERQAQQQHHHQQLQQQLQHQQQAQHHIQAHQQQHHLQQQQQQQQHHLQQSLSRRSSISPPSLAAQQQQQVQKSPSSQRQSPSFPTPTPFKRLKLETPESEVQAINGNTISADTPVAAAAAEAENEKPVPQSQPQEKTTTSPSPTRIESPPVEDLTDENDANSTNNNHTNQINNNNVTKTNGTSTPNSNGRLSVSSISPKHSATNGSTTSNGPTNGHNSPVSSGDAKELDSYTQALEYLKPLEDFVLFRENFRAIGLLSQLEAVLRKGDKSTLLDG